MKCLCSRFKFKNVDSYLDRWWYQQCYYELFCQKSAFFIGFIYLKYAWIWKLQSDLLKWTGRTLKKIESLFELFLKYRRKIPTVYLETLQATKFFQRFYCILREWEILQDFARICRKCIFCLIQNVDFQKQSVGGAIKVLEKSLKTILDKVHFIVNLYSFPVPSSHPGKPFFLQISHFTPPTHINFQTSPTSKHINNSLSVYLFLGSKPCLGKSEELNNQGMKENRAFGSYYFFTKKSNKKEDRLCMKFLWNPNTIE